MADMLKGLENKYGGTANIGYIPPIGRGRLDELEAESRKSLPELEAALDEKGVIYSPDREYAIFRVGGLVELRRKKDGFPSFSKRDVEYRRFEGSGSRCIFNAWTLSKLFERMNNDEDDYSQEWN